MKVIDHISQAKSTLFSIEILPPLKGQSIQSIFNSIEPLIEFKPAFIDVTYHREEYVYKERENGYLEKISIRKRPGTVGICSAISNKFQLDTVPHIICGGFSVEETENALIDLDFLGIDNVLVIRGDPIKSEGYFKPEPDGHKYATELLQQVVNMNKGIYLDEELENVHRTNFCIGVAGYPEKHYEAPNLKTDLKHLKAKVDIGAEYVVTQMFYDNQKYIDFVNCCRENGINVPIIPGLKPLTTRAQLVNLPKIFHIDIPEALADEVLKCKTDADVRKVGIEWAIHQSRELVKFGAPCLHYYTMGGSKTTREIASQVF
jgi:methylenetetrahydrofolate reductase (NADPH)